MNKNGNQAFNVPSGNQGVGVALFLSLHLPMQVYTASAPRNNDEVDSPLGMVVGSKGNARPQLNFLY